MKKLQFQSILLCILLLSCSEEKTTFITIASAANMQLATEEIVHEFEKKEGIKCEIVTASSGNLFALIKEHAPYQVFISADTMFPNKLFAEGVGKSKPKIYGYGKIVLWTTRNDLDLKINSLDTKQIRQIAIANPKTAPYGKAAIQAIKSSNLNEEIMSKLVFGESISQTNQFIISGAADIGITSKSTVVSEEMKNIGRWIEIDPTSYTPIAQGALLIDDSKLDARKFYDFLFGAEAKTILTKYGYIVN